MKLVVACMCTALLTAGSTAAVTSRLITSRDIKNGTIRLEDLAPAAKRGMRGPRGAQGPAGPEGQAGTTGPQGARGPGGYAHIETVIGPPSAVPAGQYGQAEARCPTGTVATGGGFTSNGELVVSGSYPPAVFTWRVVVLNVGNSAANLWAWALCGPANP
jgi:hypothetical protein